MTTPRSRSRSGTRRYRFLEHVNGYSPFACSKNWSARTEVRLSSAVLELVESEWAETQNAMMEVRDGFS